MQTWGRNNDKNVRANFYHRVQCVALIQVYSNPGCGSQRQSRNKDRRAQGWTLPLPFQLTQRTLRGKTAHLSGEHTPRPSSSPSPPARSWPAFVTWQVSRHRSVKALRPEQRLPRRPRTPGRGRAPPGPAIAAAGGLAGSVGPTGKRRKFSPPPTAAQRKVTAAPARLSAPRPPAPGLPRPGPLLTARAAAGRRTPLPRRPRVAIAPAPRYLLREPPPPAPHRGDSSARSLTSGGGRAPRGRGNGRRSLLSPAPRSGRVKGGRGGEARSVPAPLSHPSGARLAPAASPPCGRLRRDPPSPPHRLFAPPSWLSRGGGGGRRAGADSWSRRAGRPPGPAAPRLKAVVPCRAWGGPAAATALPNVRVRAAAPAPSSPLRSPLWEGGPVDGGVSVRRPPTPSSPPSPLRERRGAGGCEPWGRGAGRPQWNPLRTA